ncbi:MAL protein, partial [Atractosteus spatula]|nr:MAL protein [Atractosteus spatula]
MSSAAQAMSTLPSGLGVCTTLPDIFYILELVFGGLVWILVASTKVAFPNPQGWVMFVSVFCFVVTFLWLLIFLCGAHKNSHAWAAADVAYHFIATVFYLSAAVPQALVTLSTKTLSDADSTGTLFKIYQENIAAVVFAYVATLLYFIHTILSAFRWKNF